MSIFDDIMGIKKLAEEITYGNNPKYAEERKINEYVDQRSTTDGKVKNLGTGESDFPTSRSIHDDDWHDDLGGNGILE